MVRLMLVQLGMLTDIVEYVYHCTLLQAAVAHQLVTSLLK